mmetsp:Transcript_40565/g.53398  ORF Transcript_40565/g.53398 Transcript_40565/m.53398 type:complete len:214 (-) Transcript_40565:408-1049(-)
MPWAWSIGKSRRGELIAAAAASSALCFPSPFPMPISAVPAPAMTDLTSAKSTLIKPGRTMISEMPTTPWRKMSSATLKAFSRGVFSGMICNNLSLDTTIKVSTTSLRFAIAPSACMDRRRPSKPKGLVTTPTVKAPSSRATSATIGAAPEPVPPPIPAVTKTRSDPRKASAMSSLLSTAAFLPISGIPPAPSPLVTSIPMFNVWISWSCRAKA